MKNIFKDLLFILLFLPSTQIISSSSSVPVKTGLVFIEDPQGVKLYLNKLDVDPNATYLDVCSMIQDCKSYKRGMTPQFKGFSDFNWTDFNPNVFSEFKRLLNGGSNLDMRFAPNNMVEYRPTKDPAS